MVLIIHVMAWDRHKNGAGLSRLMRSQPINNNVCINRIKHLFNNTAFCQFKKATRVKHWI
jgi:hypothetical protein